MKYSVSHNQAGSVATAPKVYSGKKGLKELIQTTKQYDKRYEQLACRGGTTRDLNMLTGTLEKKFIISGGRYSFKAHLSNPESVLCALEKTGHHDIFFEVRRLQHGLPVYYICRAVHDDWGVYGLVVEDLHRSDRYVLEDPRFATLYQNSNTIICLRVSMFREQTARMFGEENKSKQPETDHLLYLLGRYILQGMWHVDQRFAFKVAEAFQLPNLKQTVELIYLCLSCDLGMLRGLPEAEVRRFFKDIYPHNGLSVFLTRLPRITGRQLGLVSEKALLCYLEVNRLFNDFLKTEIHTHTLQSQKLPLWKLILGNIPRLPLIAAQTTTEESLCLSRNLLEKEAIACTDRLLETTS